MLRRVLCLLLALSAAPTFAQDVQLGEQVFLKEHAVVTFKKKTIDHSLIRFPSTVEAAKDGRLWIGRGWVLPCDVMGCGEALAHYTQCVEQSPQSPVAWANRGAVLLAQNNADQALSDFNTALELQPTHPVWLVRRGDALSALGLHEDALRDYRQAASCQPVWPTALVRLGDALARCGDLDEACVCYLQVKAIDPLEPLCYFGFANARLGLGDYKKAAEAYHSTLQLDPFFTPAYLNRAEAFRAVGKYDAVVHDLTSALKIDPTMAVAHLKRGQAWAVAGKHRYASQDLTDAVRLEPFNAEAQKELARFYAACKDVRFRNGFKAVEHGEAAVELTSYADPEALTILAVAYLEIGDAQRARELQQQARATVEAPGYTVEEATPVIVEPRRSSAKPIGPGGAPANVGSGAEELPMPPSVIEPSDTEPSFGPAFETMIEES